MENIQNPQYAIKPAKARIILPRFLLLLIISPLFYLGVHINARLLNFNLSMIHNSIIIGILAALIIMEYFLIRSNAGRMEYLFYGDRIVIQKKRPEQIPLHNVAEVILKKDVFDKVTKTASITLHPYSTLHGVMDAGRVLPYVQQLVNNSRQNYGQ